MTLCLTPHYYLFERASLTILIDGIRTAAANTNALHARQHDRRFSAAIAITASNMCTACNSTATKQTEHIDASHVCALHAGTCTAAAVSGTIAVPNGSLSTASAGTTCSNSQR
eukprot:21112-Heterococcus_DN1.PRE.3